jgi:purine-nucleoside phosphorylase
MTPHLEFNLEDISNIVLMPGDPLRAKYIAENFLENAKQINSVRNMLGYTGYYNGKRISVISSGMGIPSMGIYSYELFKFYNVEKIIRIGTCGTYTNLNLNDVILVENSCSESSYRLVADDVEGDIISSSKNINEVIEETAKINGINIVRGNIHCSDVFYGRSTNYKNLVEKYNCLGVEMETYSLFHNADIFKKEASCILTVTDILSTNEKLSKHDREKSLNTMIKLALDSALKL